MASITVLVVHFQSRLFQGPTRIISHLLLLIDVDRFVAPALSKTSSLFIKSYHWMINNLRRYLRYPGASFLFAVAFIVKDRDHDINDWNNFSLVF